METTSGGYESRGLESHLQNYLSQSSSYLQHATSPQLPSPPFHAPSSLPNTIILEDTQVIELNAEVKASLTAFILKTGLSVEKALSIWVHASSLSLQGPDSYVYVLPEILTDLTLSRHEALKGIFSRNHLPPPPPPTLNNSNFNKIGANQNGANGENSATMENVEPGNSIPSISLDLFYSSLITPWSTLVAVKDFLDAGQNAEVHSTIVAALKHYVGIIANDNKRYANNLKHRRASPNDMFLHCVTKTVEVLSKCLTEFSDETVSYSNLQNTFDSLKIVEKALKNLTADCQDKAVNVLCGVKVEVCLSLIKCYLKQQSREKNELLKRFKPDSRDTEGLLQGLQSLTFPTAIRQAFKNRLTHILEVLYMYDNDIVRDVWHRILEVVDRTGEWPISVQDWDRDRRFEEEMGEKSKKVRGDCEDDVLRLSSLIGGEEVRGEGRFYWMGLVKEASSGEDVVSKMEGKWAEVLNVIVSMVDKEGMEVERDVEKPKNTFAWQLMGGKVEEKKVESISMYSSSNGYGFENKVKVVDMVDASKEVVNVVEVERKEIEEVKAALNLLWAILEIRALGGRTVNEICWGVIGCSAEVALKAGAVKVISALALHSQEEAFKTWHDLEASQIIPTMKSLRVPTEGDEGIFHDLYKVEARIKRYPLTKALLVLINNLVLTVGCPADLGEGKRRQGVSPYIDFVIDHIIPAAVGGELKFEDGEREGLLGKALSVLLTILKRYVVPSVKGEGVSKQQHIADCQQRHYQSLRTAVGHGMDAGAVFEPSNGLLPSESEFESAMRDLKTEWVQVAVGGEEVKGGGTGFGVAATKPEKSTRPMLLPKTPGFNIMSQLLAPTNLLTAILNLTTRPLQGSDNVKLGLVIKGALSAAPSVVPSDDFIDTIRTPSGPVIVKPEDWVELCHELPVALLSAVAAREKDFVDVVRGGPSLNTVKVLTASVKRVKVESQNALFQPYGAMQGEFAQPPPKVKETVSIVVGGGTDNVCVSVTPLPSLLRAMSGGDAGDVISLVGGKGTMQALGLFDYCMNRLPVGDSLAAAVGRDPVRIRRDWMAALVSNTPNDVKITMLNCLAACPGNFAVFMLGFGEKGCLESVLELLGRGEEERVTEKAWEVIWKISKEPQGRKHLVESRFWEQYLGLLTGGLLEQLNELTSGQETPADVLSAATSSTHALAYFLGALVSVVYYEPGLRARIIGGELLDVVLQGVGGRNPGGGKPSNPPPSEAGGAVGKSVVGLGGAAEVFGTYKVVDLVVLVSQLSGYPEGVQRSAAMWSTQWNRYVTCACAHAHLARSWSELVRVVGSLDGGLLLKATLAKLNGGGEEPLADVVLDLVGEAVGMGGEVDEGVVRGIAEAIGKVSEEELTGVLSSALALSLTETSGVVLPAHLVSLSVTPLHLSLLSCIAGSATSIPLAKIQSLMPAVNDPVGVWALTSIACKAEGAKNIEMATIPQQIISSVPPEEEDMEGGVGAVWEANPNVDVGGREMALFNSHLVLFDCLMASLPQSPTLRSSACDFLRARGRTGVGVLRGWPENGDVVLSYVRVLEGVSEGGGWKEGRIGKVGSKIEQGILSLGLHICNFPVRMATGVRGEASWYDPLNIASSPEKGHALRGLDGRGDWYELDYQWALKGADVAAGCLGFVRGMRGVLPINGGMLSKGIETCVRLSRTLDQKLEQIVVANNLDRGKLAEIGEAEFSWEDG
ncbi:hypothetical protein TL16_g03163 [Triparma laevis f. inornata]|uniref:Uncharacterized protein n=1 Tax=Triparma laevis f. inornata TaxID=1714386 RepID=A0A9W7E3J6_9STRA|nr:hypothetical protein TL16_g03163 [Triparma laevis f. inornata]